MNARTQPSWDAGRYPTAAEWVDWFLSNTRDGQEEIASMAIGNVEDINRCLQSGSCWIDR